MFGVGVAAVVGLVMVLWWVLPSGHELVVWTGGIFLEVMVLMMIVVGVV